MRRRTTEPPRPSQAADPLVDARPGGVVDRLGRAAWPVPFLVPFLVIALMCAAGAEAARRWFGADVGLAFYPPAGIALAALVLVGRRRWWTVLLAAGLAEVAGGVAQNLTPRVALGVAAAGVVGSLVGATTLTVALRRAGRDHLELSERSGLAMFVVCGAVIGPIAGAMIGSPVVASVDGSPLPSTIGRWWAGNAVGVVVVGSALVVFAADTARPARAAWQWTALATAATALSALAFFAWEVPPLAALLPAMVWAIFRFDVHGVALVGLVYAVVASVATATGHGQFAGIPNAGAAARLGVAQASIAVVVITGWVFAIEVRERRRAVAEREAAQRDRFRFEVLGAAGEASAAMAGAATTGEVLRAVRKQLHERLGAVDVGLSLRPPHEVAIGPHDVAIPIPDTNWTMIVRWAQDRALDELDDDYLVTVAAVVGLAIERVRLHEMAVRAAAEADRARADAEREAERLELAVEAATILVYEVDLDAQTVSTAGLTNLLGVADSVTSIESWMARIHPDDSDEHLRVWLADQATGASRSVGYRIRHHDGSWREVEDSRRFVDGPGGRRVIGALRDRTEELAERRRTRALANLSDALAVGAPDADDLTSVLGAIAAAAVPGFAERCCVHEVEDDVTVCRARAVADGTEHREWCAAGSQTGYRGDDSMVARAVRSQQPVSGAEVLCVPVLIDGQVRIVIEFDAGDDASYSYTGEDAALANEFGRRCAAIVKEVLLRSAAEEAGRRALAAANEQLAGRMRAERLQRAGAVVARAAGTSGVLAAIDAVAAVVVASRTTRLVVLPAEVPLQRLEHDLVEHVVASGQVVVWHDPVPCAGVPLRSGSSEVAAIVVYELDGTPDHDVETFLADVGRQWSESLARAVAYDLQRIAVSRTAALQSITADLAAAASIDDVREVVSRTTTLLGATETMLARTDLAPTSTSTGAGTTVVACPSGTGPTEFVLVARHERVHLGDDDARLLSTVGELVGQACTRVSLADREHVTAVQLQQAMLGRPDAVRRLDTGAAYRAAEAGLEIGGDWYDVVDLGERGAACIVGDVVGHSLAAATAMGQLRSAGRALATIASDPADLIERIEQFADSVKEARYTTLAVAFVDVDRGVLRYACAGHLPPLLVRPDGAAEFLMDARGMPLAGATGVVRRWAEVPVQPGDLLVLYTDGLVERRGETIDDGLDRLLNVVVGLRQLEPDTLCAAVVDAMLDGRAPRDDVAMLVAQPVPMRFERELSAEPAELAPLRRSLRRWLDLIGVGPDDAHDVVIAVGEGAANAIEHAYRDGATGTVRVVTELDGDDLRTRIRDDGSWRAIPAPGNRGRGTAIMRAVAERVEVRSQAEGTTVVIDHRLADSVRAGRAGRAGREAAC